SLLDIYPVGEDLARDHKKFGGVFVRVWAFGEPPTATFGVFLGAERAEQAEPRRGVELARARFGRPLLDFEQAEGFAHHTWTSGHFPWATKSSRAVARQLEQFVTFREEIVPTGQKEIASVEARIRKAVGFLDTYLDLLKPIRAFGKDVIEQY